MYSSLLESLVLSADALFSLLHKCLHQFNASNLMDYW